MNQKRLVLCLALMAVLFAGCQEPQPAAEENGPQPSIGESAPQKPLTTRMPGGNSVGQVQGEPESDGTATAFQAGTWLGTKEDGSQQYYFFSDDGSSGQTTSLESGTGLGFAYEAASGQAVFHMGSEEGTVNIQVYENLGDHNSTAAGYVIDRLTGKGMNANTGETVDLTVVVQYQ